MDVSAADRSHIACRKKKKTLYVYVYMYVCMRSYMWDACVWHNRTCKYKLKAPCR